MNNVGVLEIANIADRRRQLGIDVAVQPAVTQAVPPRLLGSRGPNRVHVLREWPGLATHDRLALCWTSALEVRRDGKPIQCGFAQA